MAYTKTNWVDGQTPLSAANLNKLETQYDEAMEVINPLIVNVNNNSYDIYQLWLELYYKGTLGQVEAANAKALIFDGFQDTLNVDTAKTDAVVDVTNKVVANKTGTPFMLTPTAISILPTEDSSLWTQSEADAMINGDTTTSVKTQQLGNDQENNPYYYAWQFDLGDSYVIEQFAAHLYQDYGAASVNAEVYEYSLDGVNWKTTSGGSTNVSVTNKGWYYWNTDSVGSKPVARYVRVSTNFYENAPATSAYIRYYEFAFMVSQYVPSKFQSKSKALPFTSSGGRLYLSAKIETGASITVDLSLDGGVSWLNMTQISSRTDPKFTDYTEYIYEVDGTGQNAVLRVTLTPNASGSNRSYLKRYGLQIL